MLYPPSVGTAGDAEFDGLNDLLGSVRGLMLAAACTDVPEETKRAAAATIRDLVADLSAQSLPRVRKIRLFPHEVAKIRLGTPWQCFPFNPMGIPFSLVVDGDTARGELLPGSLHEGPPNYLHGGFAAAIIDAFLGTLVQVAAKPCFTATLDLRYLGPVELDVQMSIEGRIVSVSGRKVVAECWISQGGKRAVEATGLFVAVEGSGVTGVEQGLAELR